MLKMTDEEVEQKRWNERVTRWTERTQTPLNVIALLTIWLSVTPITVMLDFTSYRMWWLVGRGLLSLLYALDIGIRAVLSKQPLRYVMAHPLSALVVLFPPLRLLFSIRLLRTMFSKGNLTHFLAVAVLLVLNGAVLVVIFEHSAPDASITSIPIALWWTACTVSTVGYGDYTPVTVGGRVVAVCIMLVGLTSVAVITAQIASSFMDQASSRREGEAEDDAVADPIRDVVSSGELERDHGVIERLQAIEALLRSQGRS
jgi:voltage-gated potassium channel